MKRSKSENDDRGCCSIGPGSESDRHKEAKLMVCTTR